MKLDPAQTKIMQTFAVRTPDKNAADIKNRGFETLGMLQGNTHLVLLSTSSTRGDEDETDAHSTILV